MEPGGGRTRWGPRRARECRWSRLLTLWGGLCLRGQETPALLPTNACCAYTPKPQSAPVTEDPGPFPKVTGIQTQAQGLCHTPEVGQVGAGAVFSPRSPRGDAPAVRGSQCTKAPEGPTLTDAAEGWGAETTGSRSCDGGPPPGVRLWKGKQGGGGRAQRLGLPAGPCPFLGNKLQGLMW